MGKVAADRKYVIPYMQMGNVADSDSGKKQPYSAQGIAGFIGIIIFILGCLGAGIFARSIATQNNRNFSDRLDQRTTAIKIYTQDQVASYQRILLAERLFINSTPDFSQADLKRFHDSMDISTQFPTLLGIGYAAALKKDQVSTYEQKRRDAGTADFTVHPATPEREDYTAIAFIEPLEGVNLRAIGYDMFSEPTRRQAMMMARDNNQVTITPPVNLVQDGQDASDEKGMLVYLPVYDTATELRTTEERRTYLKGYAYLIVKPSSIIRHYVGQSTLFGNSTEITIDDIAGHTATQFFTLNPQTGSRANLESDSQQYTMLNRIWRITVYSQKSRFNAILGPTVVFLLGAFASIILGYLAFLLLLSRLNKVEASYEEEVQRSKDELLALASHQLRTPASGVKQYIGMLHQGFVGELTDTQKEIVAKAYAANERQLGIINELLYVSKLDAGQIHLEPSEMDLTSLAKYIVEGFTTQATGKNIELIFHAVTPRNVIADTRYISMIIENLVSNAIKYSPRGSKVTVRLRDIGENVGLMVVDRGVGIDSDDLPRLFEKFERIDNPLSQSEGGSGLGLFLSKRLAQAHGGDITVETTIGKGSTFTLLIPKESHIVDEYVNINNRLKSARSRRAHPSNRRKSTKK